MNRKMKIIMMMVLIPALALLTGCFTRGGYNPVSDQSIAQSENQVTPQLLSNKNASDAKAAHRIVYRLRAGAKKSNGGWLKVSTESLANGNMIFVTLDELKVKPDDQKSFKINIPAREISLFAPSALTNVLGEANLPPGVYKHLWLNIKSARIVIDGQSHDMTVPSKNIRFVGSFEIKEGYRTEISIKFSHEAIKFKIKKNEKYVFKPVLKITSQLVLVPVLPPPPPPPPSDGGGTPPPPPPPPDDGGSPVTVGDVHGTVLDFVTKAPVAGANVTLAGTSFTAATDANGNFTFLLVPQGSYNLSMTHPDYVSQSFPVDVLPGQIAEVYAELSPL